MDRHARELSTQSGASSEGSNGVVNVHCGVIEGGQEIDAYTARCNISIERRTIGDGFAEMIRQDLLMILKGLEDTVSGFRFDLR